MHRSRAFGLFSLVAGLVALAATALAAKDDLVVIRSTASDIKPGMVLASGVELSLAEGTEIEVLSMNGNRAIIPGPFEGRIEVRGRTIEDTRIEAVGRAIFGLDPGTRVLGAVRVPPQEPETAAATARDEADSRLVRVNIARSGNWCFTDNAGVVLARPRGLGTATSKMVATVSSIESDHVVTLRWHGFREVNTWPDLDDLPLTDGARYRILAELYEYGTDPIPTGADKDDYAERTALEPVEITMKKVVLPNAPTETIRTLALADCRAQFAQAVAALDEPTVPGSGSGGH